MSISMDVISEKLFNRFIIEFDALQKEPLDNRFVRKILRTLYKFFWKS